MLTNKEGFQMDPKLAEVMTRIKAEHPAPAVDAANDSQVSEPVDKLVGMFGPMKAKALRRGAKTREDILRRKLPDF